MITILDICFSVFLLLLVSNFPKHGFGYISV